MAWSKSKGNEGFDVFKGSSSSNRRLDFKDRSHRQKIQDFRPSRFTVKGQKCMMPSEAKQTRQPPNDFREISVLPTPEEINSGLPFFRPNVIHGKYLDAEHYLDVHYRLLREDFMRPLREGIHCIRALHRHNKAIDEKLLKDENVWFYDNFRVSHLEVRNGVAVYRAHFNLNSSLKNIDWENSKQLKEGSLICFSENFFKTMHFATIVGSDPKDRAKGELAISLETNQGHFKFDTDYIMIENQAYFEAYRHTLGALQDLCEGNMPLNDYVISAKKYVKSPAYLTKFTKYQLTLCSQERLSFPVLDYQMWPPASAVGLDEFQYAALRSGLTKEFSIIQGPPGTGKTFIGLKIIEILLQNHLVRQSNTPILVMCYTNHALDQFLEGILKHTSSIVRIGGRSQNDQLSKCQLNALRNRRDGRGKKLLFHLYKKVEKLVEEIKTLYAEINRSSSFMMKDNTLSEAITRKHFCSLKNNYNDEFLSLKYNVNFLNVWLHVNERASIKGKLLATTPMSPEKANSIENVWALSVEKRWSLYKHWTELYLNRIRLELNIKCEELKVVYEQREEIWNERDLEILENRLVVGMTTTGAVKRRTILKQLNPQIVIFEEAAEVLEAHIVACLTASVEHVILIGDHQQLKPSTTVYELSKKFNFDVSLFERMVKNGVECHSLTVQHRMRPAIASLLVPHIYSNLQNHKSVLKYENVRGIKSNVFFINHKYSEDVNRNSTSHANQHECQFLKKLCLYLLWQDYKPSQITILTTYSGQLSSLQNAMEEQIFSDIRIAVVDNYQGEENDIILISFVRSNEEEKIGFLSISNRVCVSLSRAKIGLYAIGNFNVLARKSDLWEKIVQKLKSQNNFGNALRLCCHNHPKNFNDVSTSKDFEKFQNGVCSSICNKLLDCGHKCIKLCHVIDSDHQQSCKIKVRRRLPLCGHERQMMCHENPSTKRCLSLCLAYLPCGHKCKSKCGVPCTETCNELVPAVTTCNHTYTVECSISMDQVKVRAQCKSDCGTVYDCGHKCPHPCSTRCLQQCEVKIKVISTCGHLLSVKCYIRKDPGKVLQQCHRPCERMLPCGHLCPLKCGQICIQKCQVRVSIKASCGHKWCLECSLASSPSEVARLCTKPCERTLKCGHPCLLRCNETCSRKCYHKALKTLQCGHAVIAPCSAEVECKVPCERTLQCGHRCQLLCGQECVCKRIVLTFASCGHEVVTQCNLKLDPESLQKQCRTPCEKILECGHRCSLLCWQECECKREGFCSKLWPRCLRKMWSKIF